MVFLYVRDGHKIGTDFDLETKLEIFKEAQQYFPDVEYDDFLLELSNVN
jgi:hypothetical protein